MFTLQPDQNVFNSLESFHAAVELMKLISEAICWQKVSTYTLTLQARLAPCNHTQAFTVAMMHQLSFSGTV